MTDNPTFVAIKLRPAEIQSGMDRVRWAELLIRQLPEDHEGRNSWLLNYAGPKHEIDKQTTHLADIDAKIAKQLGASIAANAKLANELRKTEIMLADAKELLKPIADAALSLDDNNPDRMEIWEAPSAMEITAGDLRRASRFFDAGKLSASQSKPDIESGIGRWLSAALDDPAVCAEMKADIRAWFAAGEPPASALKARPCHYTQEQLDAMYEASKLDDSRALVGSEVRQLIGDIRTLRDQLDELGQWV